jgi:uncharacterized membrane protein YqjE
MHKHYLITLHYCFTKRTTYITFALTQLYVVSLPSILHARSTNLCVKLANYRSQPACHIISLPRVTYTLTLLCITTLLDDIVLYIWPQLYLRSARTVYFFYIIAILHAQPILKYTLHHCPTKGSLQYICPYSICTAHFITLHYSLTEWTFNIAFTSVLTSFCSQLTLRSTHTTN